MSHFQPVLAIGARDDGAETDMRHRGGELLRSEPNLLEVDAPITGKLRVDSCISLMGYSVR